MDEYKKIICPHCAQYFKKEKYLNAHLKNIHPQDENVQKTMYACNYCSSFFKNFRRLQVHKGRYHSSENQMHEKENKKFICDYCGKNFRRKGRLLLHIQNIHMCVIKQQKTLYSCNLCNSHFKNKLWLGRHIAQYHIKMKESHKNNYVACEEDVFTDVFKHLKALDMQKDILSQALGATDVNLIPELDIEKIKVSSLDGKILYHCDFCAKTFPKLSLLKRHITIHGTHKPYKCSVCSVKFRYSSSLRLHAKEQHYFKCKNNRNDVFLKQFENYVNKMKSNPMLYKVKKEKHKKKKLNNSNSRNKSVVQNQNLSMPTLNSMIESPFITKDSPTTKITMNPEDQNQITDVLNVLQNKDLNDIEDEDFSCKHVRECLSKVNSGESSNIFIEKKDIQKVSIIEETRATDKSFAHTSISEPIEEILDNETSLDISLSDLPVNFSFEDVSLSEIDVQKIDTDDSIAEQHPKQQNIIDNCLTVESCKTSNLVESIDTTNDLSRINHISQYRSRNDFQIDEFIDKDRTDNISNIKQNSVNSTENNKVVDMAYMEPSSRDNSICNNYVLEDTHLTSISNQIYILNNEVYIGQLVNIQNIDDVEDDQCVTRNEELQETVQNLCNDYTRSLSKIETFSNDKTLNTGKNDKDDIEDILNSLNIKVVSNTNENEAIQQVSETFLDRVLVDHTYIKTSDLQNVNNHQSEIVNPNIFIYDSQNTNKCLTEVDVINENDANTSLCTRQDIIGNIHNDLRASICEIESLREMQDSIVGLDVTENQENLLSHLPLDTQTCQENQNVSAFSTKMALSNNSNTTATFIDETILQINNDSSIPGCQNQTFLLDFETAQNSEPILETEYSLKEQRLVYQNVKVTNDEVILPTNNGVSIPSSELESFLLDFDDALTIGEISKSQCLLKNESYIKDPSTYNNEFVLQNKNAAYSPTSENQTSLNNLDGPEKNEVFLKTQGLPKIQALTYQKLSMCDDETILQTKSGVSISGSDIQPSSFDFDKEQNDEIILNSQYLLKDPISQLVPVCNDKTIIETDNDKFISNNENHDLLVDFNTAVSKEAVSKSLCSLTDCNLINQNAFSCNNGADVSNCNCKDPTLSVNSNTAQTHIPIFEPQVNQDAIISNGESTLEENIDAPASDISTQMPSVDFDEAKTSQEILQSLLSDEPLPSVSPSCISKKEHVTDILGNADEEKMLLKLLSKRNLKYMMQSDEGRFSCDLCLAKFVRKTHLNDHKKIHERNALWICDICNKVFASEKSITLHIKYHDKKQAQCKVCGVFRHPLSLRNHMRQHNNDTPYSCPICKKAFRNTSTKNYHMKVKHMKDLKGSTSSLVNLISDIMDTEVAANKTDINIPFVLPSLNQTSNVKKKLAKSASKPKLVTAKTRKDKSDITYFACECGMLFKHKNSLELHKHKYNNQPHECHFSCNVCNEVFSSKSWLTRHLRTARHKHNENKTKET